MKDNKTSDKTFRQKAEIFVEKAYSLKSNEKQVKLSESEMFKLKHELEISKIQIELQSKELALAKRQNEDLNISLFHANHSVMLLIDSETGEIKDANMAASNFYGWSKDELCNKNIADINTLSEDEVKLEMQKAKVEERMHFVFKHKLANLEIRDVEVYSSIVQFGNTTLLYSIVHDITEQKIIEEKLVESESKYRTIYESVIDVYYEATLEGIILELSPSIKILSKGRYTREELIGSSLLGFYASASDRDTYIKELTEKGAVTDYELIFKNTNNSDIYVAVSSTLKYDKDGNPEKITGVLRNITDRKNSELSLKQSNKKWEAIIAASPYGIGIMSLDGEILLASDKLVEMYGYTLKERELFIGTSVFNFVDPLSHKLLIENTKKLLNNTLYETNSEYISLKNDKSKFYAELSSTILFDEKGEPESILYIQKDITDKKKNETALILNDIRYTELAEHSKTVIWEVNLNGLYTYVSPTSETVYGHKNTELIGKKHFYDIAPKELREEVKKYGVESIKRGDEMVNYDNAIEKKDGTVIWVTTNGKPFFDSNNKLIGYRGSDVDITERKKGKQVLSESNHKLNLLMNNLNGVIYRSNFDGEKWNLSFISDYVFNISGYKAADFLNNSKVEFKNLIHKDDKEKGWPLIEKHLANKSPFEIEYRIFDVNGKERWVSEQGQGIYEDDTLVALEGFIIDITEKKKIEADLILNDIRYVQFAEHSKTVFWEVNLDGLYTYVSPLSEKVWGYSNEELIGKMHFYDIAPKQDRIYVKKSGLENLRNGNSNNNFEFQIEKKDGSLIWIANYGKPFFDKNNNILGYRGSDVEITERKLAIEELHKNDEELNEAQEIAKMGSWYLNLITNETTLSKNYYKLVEREEKDTINKSDLLFPLIYKNDVENLNDVVKKIKKTKRQGTSNVRLVMPNGKPKWFKSTILPVYENNVLIGLKGVKVDISEKKEHENEIKKLSIAIAQSPASMVITDLESTITYVSKAFTQITGYTANEVLGKKASILKSGKTSDAVYKDLWNTITSGKIWEGELENRRKNGEIYWERFSITPILNENNEISNYLAIKEDISKYKNAEQKIKELNSNLELKVEERTKELAKANSLLLQEIEERNKIAEALVESEYNYRNVVENLNEIVFKTDADGLWLFLNESWEEITGFSVEESLGELFVNYVHPEDRQRNMDLFAPLLNREKEYCRHVVRYITKAGGFRWIEVFARLGTDKEGEITGTYGTLQDITERKEIDAALEIEKQRLASIIEGTNVGTWEWNIKTGETKLNERWANILGYSLEEISATSVETFRRFVHPEDNHKSNELLEQHFQGITDYYSFESRMKHKNGSWIWVLARGRVSTWDTDGKPLLMSGTHLEITNRKNAEAALEIEKKRLASIIEGTNVGTWEWNIKTGKTEFNERWANILGYSLDEISPTNIETWMKFSHPEDLHKSNELLEQHFQGITDYYSFESRMKHKNGSWIWVLDRGRVNAWDTDGKPLLMSGTHLEITNRKKAEEELNWNKTLLELMSNSSPLGFLVVDNRTDAILYFNQRFLQIWEIEELADQMEREELKNNDIIPYCLPVLEDVPAFAKSCEPLQSESNRIVLEDEIAFTNNRTIHRYTTQIRGLKDEYFGRFYIFEDITKQKNANKEILNAKNEAVKANKAKSEFLSRMSHELRTPLTSILGFAQLMKMSNLSEVHKTNANYIYSSGKHLLHLINEVLDISAIEAGKISLGIEPIQVSVILNEVIDTLQPQVNTMSINLKVLDSSSNELYVNADLKRLKQVLINVLDNAIKYNKTGGFIKIFTEIMPKNNHGITPLRISIMDTGIGMSIENTSKVFTPFERLGAERTETEGTGLGLSVVKKLIDAMDGTIGVESILGEGSTFWFELPLVEREKAILNLTIKEAKLSNELNIANKELAFQNKEKAKRVDELEIANKEISDLKGRIPKTAKDLAKKPCTILYVEDNILNIKLVGKILSEQNVPINLITDTTGSEAVNLAIENQPDLILLDLDLPFMQGSEILDLLRKEEKTKTIPVVIITASIVPKQRDKLLKQGAKDYIKKPIDIPVFLKVLEEYLIKS